MLRTLPRVLVLFVVVNLLLTSIIPSASARPIPRAPQRNPIEPALPIGPQAAQPAAQPGTHTIHLKSGDVTPGTADRSALSDLARTDGGRVHILLQLDFIPRDPAKAEFEKNDVKLLAYVPDYAWIASVPASDPAAALDLTGVTWAGALTVDDKLDPMIQSGEWGSWNLAPDGIAAVSVAMHQDEAIETGRALVATHGGQITGEVQGIRTLIVEMPAGAISALAAEDAVQWIEAVEPPLGPTNDGIRQQIGVAAVNAAPYNLNGTNVDVLVYDVGQAGDHVDFGARLIHGDTDTVSDHSTHVAGTVGGSGANSAAQSGTALQWRGMAPSVDLLSYGTNYLGSGPIFYQNVPDIEADWAAAQNTYGADLGTASVGSNIYLNDYPCSIMGNYGTSDVLVDQIVRGGNSVVGVGDKYISTWAQGNERPSACNATGYSTTAPPAAAKNPIHVGASNTNNNSMTSFSSWGPTDDGRIKPIVVAGGCQSTGDMGIKSTDNNPVNAYTVMCGTSMATPAVAGGIALMLQQYRATYGTAGNFWPSTAKAILMQTANDFGNPGPDYQWGFGQVRIQQAVDLIRRRSFEQDFIIQGKTNMYTFVVTNTAAPVQVSLAWDDFQATFNASTALINNLNLELIAPSGTVWRPWILDPANPANNATRGVNNRDNQEQVTVPTPEKGTWLVRVSGTTVPQGPQDYSLACEGCRAVNAGVCQTTVDNAPLFTAASPIPNSEGADFVPQMPPAASPSAGEQWQIDLEQGPLTAPGTTPLADDAERFHTALREFDAARNAGAEAVIAFAEQASAEVRAVIEPAVTEAQAEIAARNNPITSLIPSDPARPLAPNAFRVGVNGACAYNTIQEGINAATNGQTVRVMGDFFGENLAITGGKVITIEGGYNATCTAIVPGTISRLDGTIDGSVVDVINGSIVTLKNLKLSWGSTFGAGLDVYLGGHATLDNTDLVHNNGSDGGGIYVGTGSQVTLTNGSLVQNNTASFGGGAIVFGRLNSLDANSDITGNCSTSDGGGAYVSAGTLTMNNADLTGNQAAATSGEGGALFVLDSKVILDNSRVMTNTAGANGGGIRLFRDSALDVRNGSLLLNNRALSGEGGGVFAAGVVTITLSNATLHRNTANTNGGAIWMNGGTLDATGWWDIRYNSAGGNGGAVAVYGTGDTDFIAGGDRSSLLAVNSANGNGGALYVANTDYVTLYAINGQQLNLNTNSAGGHGGAAFANNGAFFDVYGQVQATSNVAGGNGGVFSVGGGSQVWVDDFNIWRPQILVNTADNGGAIYASASSRVACDGADFGFNSNGNKATSGSGGAIYFSGSTLRADNCTFRNNQAQAGDGGAIAAYTSTLSIDTDYAALPARPIEQVDRARSEMPQANSCNPVTAQCSQFSSNRAISSTVSNGNGGAIYNNGSLVSINNTYLHRNLAVRGGALYQENATARGWLSNTLVYSNTSLAPFGAGIRNGGGAMTLTHVTAANNTGGAGFSPGIAQNSVYNSIIWGNSTFASGSVNPAPCNIDQGGAVGPARDPQFVAAGAGENYRLLASSPARDACVAGMPTDLDNRARPIGAQFDMGAYETIYVRAVYLPLLLK